PTAHIVQILDFPPVLGEDCSNPIQVVVGDRDGRYGPRVRDGRRSSEEVVSVGRRETRGRVPGHRPGGDLVSEGIRDRLPRDEGLEEISTNGSGRPTEGVKVLLVVEALLRPEVELRDLGRGKGSVKELDLV